MERLTKRQGNSVIIPIEQKRGQTFPVEDPYQKAIDKLAAYEDTGLEPEEIGDMKTAYDENQMPYMLEATGSEAVHIVDLLQAEAEGRLVVLPVKVGDTVFAELSYDGGCSEIDTGKVFAIGIDERGTMWVSVRFESGLKYHYPSDNIGKDVFLTRAEAEAALEKMKGE